MADDEEALRDLLARGSMRFEPLDGAALRASADAERGHRGVRRVLLPVAVAVLIAGIVMTTFLLTHGPSAAGPPAAGGPTQTATSPPGDQHTAAHTFQLRLILPGQSFPANGQPIHAYVLAMNNTGRPVVISDACNGWLAAGLTGAHVRFDMFSGGVGCASSTIPRGTTRYRVTIETTYMMCQQGKQPGTPNSPHCLGPGDDRIPDLPAGSYQAVLRTMSTSVRPVLPEPQPITLTAVR